MSVFLLQTGQEALVMQRSRLNIRGHACHAVYSPMHIVRSHALCTVQYVLETRAPGYALKARY